MNRSILAAFAAATLFGVIIGASDEAAAQRRYRGYYGDGIIGGLSANAIVGGYGYYPGYVRYPGYVGYPGYPSTPGYVGYVRYPAPTYPPPGCIIKPQRVYYGHAWRTHKIRVCH
jgi:hypothetical protein